eukprot:6492022-Amphidinium_carterae.3
MARGRSNDTNRQPDGTVERRQGHQPRRSGKGGGSSRSLPSAEQTEILLGLRLEDLKCVNHEARPGCHNTAP